MKSGGPLRRVGKKGKRDAEELRAVKAELLLRSRGRCEADAFSDHCTGFGVLAHHRRRRAQGGSNEADTLLWICVACHDAIHARVAEATERGFLIRGVA